MPRERTSRRVPESRKGSCCGPKLLVPAVFPGMPHFFPWVWNERGAGFQRRTRACSSWCGCGVVREAENSNFKTVTLKIRLELELSLYVVGRTKLASSPFSFVGSRFIHHCCRCNNNLWIHQSSSTCIDLDLRSCLFSSGRKRRSRVWYRINELQACEGFQGDKTAIAFQSIFFA